MTKTTKTAALILILTLTALIAGCAGMPARNERKSVTFEKLTVKSPLNFFREFEKSIYREMLSNKLESTIRLDDKEVKVRWMGQDGKPVVRVDTDGKGLLVVYDASGDFILCAESRNSCLSQSSSARGGLPYPQEVRKRVALLHSRLERWVKKHHPEDWKKIEKLRKLLGD
ncbi:MAG: hypothetical protein HQ530_02420 [Parcubacteria group bacterium]|nr:hypothetical protein [Parcubacteria group bacterium]